MNELIEELWRVARLREYPGIQELINKVDFTQAIQTACKAQRNACARVYERDYIDKGGYNIHDYIASAEIERCDYE